jgi:predicted ATPase
MITKWTISNFKSILKEMPLPLAPLTLFAGPNSSGKSTILQSVLLVSQTLSHKIGSRSVVLNGVLTRLGQFDDLRSYDSEFDQITIEWECHPTEPAQTAIIENMRFSGPVAIYGRHESIKEISCKLSFDANPGSPERDLYQLQPKLFLFTMSLLVRGDDNEDRRCEFTVTRAKDSQGKTFDLNVEEQNNEIACASMEYDVFLDQDSLEELREEFITAETVGCSLRHFLPDRLYIRLNMVEEISRYIQMALMDELPRYRRAYFMNRDLVFPNELVVQLRRKLGEKYSELFEEQKSLLEVGTGISVREWMDRVKRLSPEARRELRRLLTEWKELQPIVIDILRSERKAANESEYQLLPHRLPMDLMNASAYLSMFFSNAVKYLGPLRDEPKAQYPLAAHADPTDVGLRGEMTAAVLNLHRDRKIRYIPSSAFEKKPFDPVPVTRSLELAVIDWLKYLGVAETAQSVDKGKLGHELKVTLSEEGPKHDLTHVGVGVSQVLPILVMSLLAERDTALIFEQPELHLHPKVQTRLGDFFLSIVLMGKQCLIETHSEYLINRLRYRAAEETAVGKANRVTEHLKMYFVEKIDGASNFREVKVNEFGAIIEWPNGFFDQSQRETEAILRAASIKRKARKEG